MDEIFDITFVATVAKISSLTELFIVFPFNAFQT